MLVTSKNDIFNTVDDASRLSFVPSSSVALDSRRSFSLSSFHGLTHVHVTDQLQQFQDTFMS